MDLTYYPLSESCAKALGDKIYDKRKLAAGEIEKTVIELNNKNSAVQIKKLIEVLANDFATSRDPNRRKGGLIGLAATSLGLGKDSELYIKEIVSPIITCLTDADLRVRYFACESLYNVVKVARTAIIPLFPDIFQALLRLVTDPDQAVKDGSELLDRLLKDIVTESSSLFNLDLFIPLLRERVYVKSSFGRQYVISWISVLNAVPEINIVTYLTDILDGLFLMLEDKMIEIHRMCETLLNQFLKSIRQEPSYVKIKDVLICLIGHAQSLNELIQLTAINWIKELILIFGPQMIPYYSGIFTAILPCLAFEGESRKSIRDCAFNVNKSMIDLLIVKENKKENIEKIDLNSVMEVLGQYLNHNSVQTKVAVLKWIHHLLTEIQGKMCSHATNLFSLLLNTLSDNSDEVVLQGLTVLAEIVNSIHTIEGADFNKIHYKKFLTSLSNLFYSDKKFLEYRGSLIIRQLCVLLNAEYIYRTFAEIIAEETTNIKFASTIVRSLNMILLTSSELFDLRQSLRDLRNQKSASLFTCLYKSWVHCPISTLALGLLAQSYEHVSELVLLFGELEITLDFLTELDKLIQLIESPIFASLRLVLVSKSSQQADTRHLVHALFGILMLMPQTDAFITLKNRLQCVPNYWNQTKIENEKSIQYQSKINFSELLEHFKKIQQKHHEFRITSRRSVL